MPTWGPARSKDAWRNSSTESTWRPGQPKVVLNFVMVLLCVSEDPTLASVSVSMTGVAS